MRCDNGVFKSRLESESESVVFSPSSCLSSIASISGSIGSASSSISNLERLREIERVRLGRGVVDKIAEMSGLVGRIGIERERKCKRKTFSISFWVKENLEGPGIGGSG